MNFGTLLVLTLKKMITTMEKLKKGDLVKLIIGSKKMKISSIYGRGLVECETNNKNGQLKKYYFRPESLVLCH